MSDGFGSPVAGGGGTLIRPSLHSPNYVAGSSGWSIKKDGSVEFNNGVFRGTVSGGSFVGTNWVENQLGSFFYSGTPATGNLVGSITPAPGSDDGFGNSYLAGFTTYNHTNHSFVNIHNGQVIAGPFASTPPYTCDTTDAMALQYTPGSQANTLLQSHLVPGTLNDAVQVQLFPGAAGLAPPTVTIKDALGTAQSYGVIAGAWTGGDLTGTAFTWQTNPAYNANWATSTTFNGSTNWAGLKFRRDAMDNAMICGAFKATASWTSGVAVCQLPAGYRPTEQWPLCVARNHGGVVTTDFMAAITAAGNLDIITNTGGGVAAGDEFLISPQSFPLEAILQ